MAYSLAQDEIDAQSEWIAAGGDDLLNTSTHLVCLEPAYAGLLKP